MRSPLFVLLTLAVPDAGTAVAFTSYATNLDPADGDSEADIYLKNLDTGAVTLVSTSDAGVNANNGSFGPDLSRSGGRVAFGSSATNLDPADGDTGHDVYVKDLASGNLRLASASDSGVKGNDVSSNAAIAASGLQVAFRSEATNLDPLDADSTSDIYVKTLATGDLVLVSTSDGGAKANGDNSWPAVSGDGTRVAFESTATNLDPADTNPDRDIYVKDHVSGDIALVSATPDGASGAGGNAEPAVSGDGFTVAFDSVASTLDPADTDTIPDVYVGQPFLCTAIGSGEDDVLVGTSGRDVLCGQGGNDTLVGRGGNDVLLGGAGDDVLDGGPGPDELDGGTNADAVTYADSSAGIEVHLEGVGVGGAAEGDTIVRAEHAVGSAFDDTLYGDAGVNSLTGGPGSDVLAGAEGDDVLAGEGHRHLRRVTRRGDRGPDQRRGNGWQRRRRHVHRCRIAWGKRVRRHAHWQRRR